jgi:hypothetical protein
MTNRRAAPQRACWVLFLVLSILVFFFFVLLHSHLQIGFEEDTTNTFIRNKLRALPDVPTTFKDIEVTIFSIFIFALPKLCAGINSSGASAPSGHNP